MKRYDDFDSKRPPSCGPERCAATLRHAVTPLLQRPRTRFRPTAFIQAHRAHRRRGLRRCYTDRVPLFRPTAPIQAHRAHRRRGLRRCYSDRVSSSGLTVLFQAHRIHRRRGLRRCYSDRVPRLRPHRALPGTPHTPPTRLAPLLQRPRTPVAAARAASGGCVYLRILRAALLARLFAKAAFIMATVPHQSRP